MRVSQAKRTSLLLKKPKSGSLYIFVIFVIVSISILAGKFFQISRQQQSTNFRLEQSHTAKELADSAKKEAYARIIKQSENPDTQLSKWLTDRSRKDAFKLHLPGSEAVSAQLLKSNLSAEISCELKKFDFRFNSHENVAYFPENQGQGTLSIIIKVNLFHGLLNKRKIFGGKLISHHDYQVTAIVSQRKNSSPRTDYSQSFVLDYALLVRDGLEEFRYSNGQLINDNLSKLHINQENLTPANCGKIYFGGADSKNYKKGNSPPIGNYVFFNLGEDFKDAVPAPARAKVEINQTELLELIPTLNNLTQQMTNLSSSLHNAKGAFIISTTPTFRHSYSGLEQTLEKKSIEKLISFSEGSETNSTPFCLNVCSKARFSENQFLQAALEGNLRKRFHYFVHFYIDLSDAHVIYEKLENGQTSTVSEPVQTEQIETLKKLENRVLCTPYLAGTCETAENEHFLRVLNEKYFEKDGVQLVSSFNASHPIGLGSANIGSPNPDYPSPVFFNSKNNAIDCDKTGMDGFRPFNNFELWSRRNLKLADLEKLEIIDYKKKIIRPRGIIHIDEETGLTIGDGDWQIEGRGILVAKRFSINGSIKKSSANDLLVFYARRDGIEILTEKLVEASLIAVNDDRNAGVRALKPLNLKGALVVDRLNLPLWEPGDHKLEYDPALKRHADSLYSISISNWPTFQTWETD